MRGTALVRGLVGGAFPQVRGVSAGACAALIRLRSMVRFHLAPPRSPSSGAVSGERSDRWNPVSSPGSDRCGTHKARCVGGPRLGARSVRAGADLRSQRRFAGVGANGELPKLFAHQPLRLGVPGAEGGLFTRQGILVLRPRPKPVDTGPSETDTPRWVRATEGLAAAWTRSLQMSQMSGSSSWRQRPSPSASSAGRDGGSWAGRRSRSDGTCTGRMVAAV